MKTIRFTAYPDGYRCSEPGFQDGEFVKAKDAEALVNALKYIAKIGGNLPDDRLTDRTGPNDAAHRGLMYCTARKLARDILRLHAEEMP